MSNSDAWLRSHLGWSLATLVGLSLAGCDSESAGQPQPGPVDGGVDTDGSVGSDAGDDDAGQGAGGDTDAAVPAWSCPGQLIEVTGVAAGENIQPAAQAAADSAQDGDCLVLPAGEYPLDGTVQITKRISLLGHGPGDGGTWLRRRESASDGEVEGWGTMVSFEIDSREPSGIVMAGIRLSSKAPSLADGDGGSLAADYGVYFREVVDFVVTDCRFENFGYAGIQIRHDDDLSRGLIYGNEFIHNLKGSGLGLGYGIATYGTNDEWIPSAEFGTANFIFVEDNYFREHRHALAGGGCARYVARHNEIVDNLWGHAIDAHEGRAGGLGTSNHFSTRAVEAYDNELRNDHFRRDGYSGDGGPIEPGHDLNDLVVEPIVIRGGEAVVHDNRIEGYLRALAVITFTDGWPATYPIPTQIGYASGLALGSSHSGTGSAERDGDLFFWDNDYQPYIAGDYSYMFLNARPQYLEEGRDYHLQVTRPDYTPYVYPHPGRIPWQGIPAD